MTTPSATIRVCRVSLALAGVLAIGVVPAAAQETPPETPPKTTEDKPRSLDELLGLDEEPAPTDGETPDVTERRAEEELQRRLDENELGNAFAEAIAKMGVSADQLEVHFDTGLGTQRLQEEILAQLDHLLDQAKKQQNSSSSSSSSSSQSSQSQSQAQPGKQGQKQQKSQGQQRQSDASDSNPDAEPPARVDGDINTIFEEARTEWGTLPQRIRDLLLQGREEKFSSVYEQLTRDYYRRLAEEGSN